MPLAKIIREAKVRHLDTSFPLVVSPETPLSEAIEFMRKERKGYVFICEHDALHGILTDRDILLKVVGCGVSYDRPVRDFMTPNPIVVDADASLDTAIQLMHQGGFRHLPLVDSNGKPFAVVSVRHIINYIVEHFPQDVLNLPPRLNQKSQTVEGG